MQCIVQLYLLNQQLSSLGILLSNLLGLNGSSVFAAKGQVSDGHIIHDKPEVTTTLGQLLSDEG